MDLFEKREIRVGDRVLVHQWFGMKIIVERIERDPKTGNVAIYLDWGEFGKSRVWAHDEGAIWRRYENVN